ncbi:MAG: hypothetical protein RSB39_09310 [Oscillospiraceae bacterium]
MGVGYRAWAKGKREPAVFTVVERATGHYLRIHAEDKKIQGIAGAMQWHHGQFAAGFLGYFAVSPPITEANLRIYRPLKPTPRQFILPAIFDMGEAGK